MLTNQDWQIGLLQTGNSLTDGINPTAPVKVFIDKDRRNPSAESLFNKALSTHMEYKNRRPISFKLPNGFLDNLEIIRSIPMILGTDQKSQKYIVKDEIVGEYGIGNGIEDAKQDYIDNLITFYLLLQKRTSKGDPRAGQQFALLQTYIRLLNDPGRAGKSEGGLEESVVSAYVGMPSIRKITLEENHPEYVFNCLIEANAYNDEIMDELLEREYIILQQFPDYLITFHYIPDSASTLGHNSLISGNGKIIFGD